MDVEPSERPPVADVVAGAGLLNKKPDPEMKGQNQYPF